MRIVPKPTKFQWDDGNKDKNYAKHRVDNNSIEEVFFNLPLLVVGDHKHSSNEKRYLALGKTDKNKKLSIIFTIRSNKVRTISARPMSAKERKIYEAKR